MNSWKKPQIKRDGKCSDIEIDSWMYTCYTLYGSTCNTTCGNCKHEQTCDKTTGECLDKCKPHFKPPFCKGSISISLHVDQHIII